MAILMPPRVLMAFPLAVVLGVGLWLAPARAWAGDGDASGGITLPEPPNTVRIGGHSVAMQVQSSLGRAAAGRMSSSSGGTVDRKRRFRRVVTWILLLLAAAVLFLKFLENEEPPASRQPPKGSDSPGPGGAGPASDKKPGERPPGPRGC